MKKLKSALNLEKSVREMLIELRAQLYKDVSKAKSDDIKTIKPNMVIVKCSNLDGLVLTPSYYIPSSQAEAIDKKLNGVKTATTFINELQKMIDEKKVKNGNNATRLNSKTIEVLEKHLNDIE